VSDDWKPDSHAYTEGRTPGICRCGHAEEEHGSSAPVTDDAAKVRGAKELHDLAEKWRNAELSDGIPGSDPIKVMLVGLIAAEIRRLAEGVLTLERREARLREALKQVLGTLGPSTDMDHFEVYLRAGELLVSLDEEER